MINQLNRKTILFTLRLWAENNQTEGGKWRGKLQAVQTGEAAYFNGWLDMIEKLETVLQEISLIDNQD